MRWPDDARCVVALTVDFDGTANETGLGYDPAGSRAAGAYSARRGVYRFLEIFDRHGVPATFFVPGYDAELHPDLIHTIVRAGHEVAAHGYLHERAELPPEEEEVRLRKTHQILTALAGQEPRGWRNPGGQKGDRTLVVLRELGYIYDSSDKDHDRPYPAMVGGKPSTEILELPNNTSSLDDFPLYVEGAATPDEVLQLWRAEFETLYRDTGYFVLTVHPRSGFGSGTPARARVIDRLIRYIKGFPGVRFVRMVDLARWCLDPANGFLDTEGGG
jgi:peptidoglycan/xylan/chitin deacetylase (PgdA/CDA1 family)